MQAMAETDSGNMGMIVKRVSVPIGLEELMEGLTKEVLLKKPKDLYIFASEYFSRLVILRERNSNHKAYPIRAMQSVTQLKTPDVLNGKKIPPTRPSRHVSRQLSVQNKPPLVTKSNQSEPIRNVIQKSRDRKQDAKKEVTEKQQTTKRERSLSTKDSTPRSTSSVQSTPREKRQKSNSRQVKTFSVSEEKKLSKTDKKGKNNKKPDSQAEKRHEANKENLKALSKGSKKAVTEKILDHNAQEDADKSENMVTGIEEVKKIEVIKAEHDSKVSNDNSENIARTNEPSLAAADFGKTENTEEVALIKSDAKTEYQNHKDDKIVEDSLQLEKSNSSGNGDKNIEIKELEEQQTHDETPLESGANKAKISDEVRNKEVEVEAENEVNNAEKTQDNQTATNAQTIQSDVIVKTNDSKDIDGKENDITNVDKADEVPIKIDDNNSEPSATSKNVNDDFINIVNTEDNSAAVLKEAETIVNTNNSKLETDIPTSEKDKNSDDQDQADSSIKLAEGHKASKEIISSDSDAANKSEQIVDIKMKQMGDSDEILVVSISEKTGPSAIQEECSGELKKKIDAIQEPPIVENIQKMQFFRENKELGSQKNCEVIPNVKDESDQAQNSQVTEQIINYNIAQKQPGRIDSPIKSFLNSFLSSEQQHVFYATASNNSQFSNKGMSEENVLSKSTNIDLEPTNEDNIKTEYEGVNEEKIKTADENKPNKSSDSLDVPTNDTTDKPGIKNLVFNSVKDLLDFNPSDIFIDHERTSSDKDEFSDASNNLKLIIKETDSSKTNTNISSEEPDSVAMLSSKIGGLRNKRSVTGDEIEEIVSYAETKNQNLSQEEDPAVVKTDTSSTMHEEKGSSEDNTDLKADSNASNGEDKVQVLSKETHVEDPVSSDTVKETDSAKLGNVSGFSEDDISAKREHDEKIDKFDKEIVGSLGEGIVDKNTDLVKKVGNLVDQVESETHDESIKEGGDKEIIKYVKDMSNSLQENVDASQNANLVGDQDTTSAHGESDKKGEDNDIDKNINGFLKGDLDNAAHLVQKVANFVDQDKSKVHEESVNKEEDTETNGYSKDISDSLKENIDYATQRTGFMKEDADLVDQGNNKTRKEFDKQRDTLKGDMDSAVQNANLVKEGANLVDQYEDKTIKESFKTEDDKEINECSKDIGETPKEKTDYATQHIDLVKENDNLVDQDQSKNHEKSDKNRDYKYDKDISKEDMDNTVQIADLVKETTDLVDRDQSKTDEDSELKRDDKEIDKYDKVNNNSPKGDIENAALNADFVKVVNQDQSNEKSDKNRNDNEIDKYDKGIGDSLKRDFDNADLVEKSANLVDQNENKSHEDSNKKENNKEIDKYDKDVNDSLKGNIDTAAQKADLVQEGPDLVKQNESKNQEEPNKNKNGKYDKGVSESLKRDIDSAAHNADLVKKDVNWVEQDENKTHKDSDKKKDDKEIDKYDKDINDYLKENIDIAAQNADLVQEGPDLVKQDGSKNQEEPDKSKNGKYDKDVSESLKRDIDNAAQTADLVKKDANWVDQNENKTDEDSDKKEDDKEIDKYDKDINDSLKGNINIAAQNADLVQEGVNLVEQNESKNIENSCIKGDDKEVDKYDTNMNDYLKGDIDNAAQNADLVKVDANLADQDKDEAHEESDKKKDEKEIGKNNKAIDDSLKGEIATQHTDLIKASPSLVDQNESKTHEESEKQSDDKEIEKYNGDSLKGDSDNAAQNTDLMEKNAKDDKGINKTYFSEEETGKTASDSVNQQTDNADMPSLESIEGRGISKENTFVKEEAKDQLEGKRRPKIGDIEQVASVIEVVKNIYDSKLFTDKPNVAAVGEYLNIFLQNEQNNVFQSNSSIGSRPSDINKKKKSKLTHRAKQERSFSQANLITDEKKANTGEVKIKRARSVGVLKTRDAESKSKIPTPVRRSAGRRPLVRQLEASSKELEEKLNFKRSSTNDSKEGNKSPTGSSKDDALIAKTILTGVKGVEKHIEVIDEHLKKSDRGNVQNLAVSNEPVFSQNNELVEDNQEVKFQSKGESDEAQKINEAATKIQKTWKGFNVRRSLEARKGNIDLETNQYNETNPDTREVKEMLIEGTQSEDIENNIKPKSIEDYEKHYEKPEVSEDVHDEDMKVIVETNQVTKAESNIESAGSKEGHISGIRSKRYTEPHLSDVGSKENEDYVHNNEASMPTTDKIEDIKKPTVEFNESDTASQNKSTEIHMDESGHVSDQKQDNQDSKTNVTSTSIDNGEVKNEVAKDETNESGKKEVTVESGHNKDVEKPIIDESGEKIDMKSDEKAETSVESNRIGIKEVEVSKVDVKIDEKHDTDLVKNETSGSNKGGILTKTSQNEDVEIPKENKEAKTHIEPKIDDDFEKKIEINGNEEAKTNQNENFAKRTDSDTNIDADKNIEGNESNEGRVLIEAMNENIERHIEDSGKHIEVKKNKEAITSIEPAPDDGFEKNIEVDVNKPDSDKYIKDNEEKLRTKENKDKVNEVSINEFDKNVDTSKDKGEKTLIEPNQDVEFEKIILIKKDKESGTDADIKTNGSNKEGISLEAHPNENIEPHKLVDTKENKVAETHVELNRGDDFKKNVEIKEVEDPRTDAKTIQTIESQIRTENGEHKDTKMKPDEFVEHVDAKKSKESETHIEPNTKGNEDTKTGVLSSHSANDDKEKAHSNLSLDSTGFNSQHVDVKDSQEAGLEVGITNRIQEVTEAHAEGGSDEKIAATKIQSAWRGFVVRKMMKHSNAQGKGAQEEAVIKIQAVVRGFLERLKYDKIKADAYKGATGESISENTKLTEGDKVKDKVKREETIELQASNDDVDATKIENAENIDNNGQPEIAKNSEHTSNQKTDRICADMSLENEFRSRPADSTNSEIKESQNQKSVTETEENSGQIMAALSDSKAIEKEVVNQHSQIKGDSDATRNDQIHQVSKNRPNSNGRADSDNPEVKEQSNNKPDFYRSNTVVEPILVKKAAHQLGEDDVNDQKDDNNNSSKEETELERDVRTAVQEVVHFNTNLTPLEQEISQAVKDIMENKSESENDNAKPHLDQIETILKSLPEVPTNEIPKIIARSGKDVVSEEHSHSVTSENDASVEIPADDLSSVGSVDSIVTVVLKPKSASQKKPEDVEAEPTSKKLHSKALSTSALEDHVELIDQVQNSLLDQLSGKTASTTNTFDIEQLRKELHDAATLYNNTEDHKASLVDHDAEVMEYLYDFEPEDDEAYETRRSRTPLRELPDIAEEAESKDDDLESASFCKTFSARKQKVIEGKPLDDLVETFDPPVKSREIVISDDNIKIRDNKSLLHTSELHDTVVIPVTDKLSPKEDSAKDTSLKHTSEFHDTVVVPLPSGADVKIKNASTENVVGTSQANLVDNGNQTSTQQAPAGVEVVTSRRRWRDGVDVAGAQAPLKDTSPAKPESDGAFTHQSPPQPPRYARQAMESENNNNKRNNAISNSATDKNMETQAATKIQAGFRGYQVRKQMKAKNASLDQKRQLRKRSSRENIKDPDLEEKSAVKIQAGVRGFLVRRRQKKQVSSSASA